MKKIITAIFILVAVTGSAQKDSTISPLTISAYLETYYTYDFGNPPGHDRPPFVYSFNRHNEVNINMAMIKAAYQTSTIRANLALMTGTYANANLAAEPGVLKNIYEANAGIKLSKKKELWVDAGIFASHIGFESAIGKDCWALSRSIMADNSPYYESGLKLSYTSDNGKWFASGLLLNGWQRIQRVNGNNTPAFGHQLTYKPTENITLNSSSFVGSDKPDSSRQMRYFHNFYTIIQLTRQLAITAGFDIGVEQKAKGSSSYNSWYTPVLMVKLSPHNRHHIVARGEYYKDANGVIINSGTSNGFQTWSYSLNYDWLIHNNVLWRVEGRGFTAKDRIFYKGDKPASNNFFISTALALSF